MPALPGEVSANGPGGVVADGRRGLGRQRGDRQQRPEQSHTDDEPHPKVRTFCGLEASRHRNGPCPMTGKGAVTCGEARAAYRSRTDDLRISRTIGRRPSRGRARGRPPGRGRSVCGRRGRGRAAARPPGRSGRARNRYGAAGPAAALAFEERRDHRRQPVGAVEPLRWRIRAATRRRPLPVSPSLIGISFLETRSRRARHGGPGRCPWAPSRPAASAHSSPQSNFATPAAISIPPST